MKTILFPTDFSKNAENALRYATDIAVKTQSKLILLNAFWVPIYEFDEKAEIKSKEKNFRKESLNGLLDVEKNICAVYPALPSEIAVVNAFTADAIKESADKYKADLIVMGTKGATGLKEIIMGSNTVAVINKVKRPILVTPEEAEEVDFRKIAFATEFDDQDGHKLKFITQLGAIYNAEITLVHVSEDDFIIETADHVIINDLKKEVKKSLNYKNLKTKILKGEVDSALANFVDNDRVDLLVMVASKKGILERIFNLSHTNKLAFQGKKPLLVLHKDDEKLN